MNIQTVITAAAVLCTHYGCFIEEIQMVFMGEHEVALVYPPKDTEPIPEEVVSRIVSLSDCMCVKQVDPDDAETPEYMNFSGVVLSLI